MAFGSDRSANFVIAAKDAATKPIGNIGKAMGRLRSSAGAAFKAIAAGAVAAGAAIAAFTVAAIKSAVEDEQATIRLNAALKARGFELEQLGPKVEEQIKAMQRLGFTDDQVRSGLEIGSRFFKNQEKLLQANAVAANIAAATGKDLGTVMMAIGRGAQGSTRGLMSLGIQVEKGAKLQDILRIANEKYAGVADEVANSTAGKFAAAQIALNEQFEAFGYRFLPAVNTALEFLSTNVLPIVDQALNVLGDTLESVATDFGKKGGVIDSISKVAGPILEDLKPAIDGLFDSIGKLLGKVGELVVALWDDGNGPLAIAVSAIGGAFEVFLGTLNFIVQTITAIINLVTEALRLLDQLASAQGGMNEGADAAAASGVFGYGNNRGSITTNTNLYLDGSVVANSTNTYLGTQLNTGASPRTNP
jgi:hypothetical protein